MLNHAIIHIPHSSNKVPFWDGYIKDKGIVRNEILKLTDWYTDELFKRDENNMVVADFSRVFCDPERFHNDNEEVMSEKGMGVLYTHTDSGNLMRKVSNELREKILSTFYFPHHQKLNNLVQHRLNNFGQALIIDGHSLSNTPFYRDLHQETNRPDFSIGTDPIHTPQKLIDKSSNYFQGKGFSFKIDEPYSGTIVPTNFYQKNSRVSSIMLEINRDLYLEPDSHNKNTDFSKIQEIVHGFIELMENIFNQK